MNDDLIARLRALHSFGAPKEAADSLEAQAKRIEELKAVLRLCVACLEQSDTSTGYCMCGSSVDHDAWEAGHTPVDAGDYYAKKAMMKARAALEKPNV
jgi:hypothetical protein